LDWDAYKQLCDTPNVFPRWMLEQTCELLAGELREQLTRNLADAPLDKPSDHRGGAATDMFVLRLPLCHAIAVRDRVRAAVAAGESTSATAGRGLGGFEEAWQEYVQHVGETGVC